jgi:hypothetical protein
MEITEESADSEDEVENKVSAAIPNREEKEIKSSSRLSRMERFLAGTKEEEIEEKPKGPKLSASERLRLLKEEDISKEEAEQDSDESEEEIIDSENDKEKPQRSKKRKDPPKGGSFGPTVGGF